MRHFSPQEFGAWYRWMDEDFLYLLDEWRDRIGFRVKVNARNGLGRDYGSRSSQHYFDPKKPRMLSVADVAPYKLSSGQRVPITVDEARYCFWVAEELGFTGIGVYPQWNTPGFHLDLREPRNGRIAKWSAYYNDDRKQIYVSVDEAWDRWTGRD